MRTFGMAVAIGLAAISPAMSADINAPAEKKITVKSELQRGSSASSDCFHKNLSDWLSFVTA